MIRNNLHNNCHGILDDESYFHPDKFERISPRPTEQPESHRVSHLPHRRLTGEITRYLIVGGGTYLADFIVYLMIITLSPALYLQGNVVGRLAGALLGFMLHKHWTFGGEHVRSTNVQALSYALLLLFNIGFSSVLLISLQTLLPGLGPVLARIITDVVVIGFTFVCSRYIFRRHDAAGRDLEAPKHD